MIPFNTCACGRVIPLAARACHVCEPSPVARVAADIEQRERDAPELADVPFSLTSEPATRRAKQRGLF